MSKREYSSHFARKIHDLSPNEEMSSDVLNAPPPSVAAHPSVGAHPFVGAQSSVLAVNNRCILMTNEITKIAQKSCSEMELNKEYKIVALELMQTFYGAKAVTTCIDIMENKSVKFLVHLTPYFTLHYLELENLWKKYQPHIFLCLHRLDEEKNQKFPVYHITAMKGYDEVDGNKSRDFRRTLLMVGYFIDVEKYPIPDSFKALCIPDGPSKA